MADRTLMDEVKFNLGVIYEVPEEAIPEEFFDFLKIVAYGAKKHDSKPGKPNYLEPNGRTCSNRDVHSSLFRHVAKSYAGVGFESSKHGVKFIHAVDEESGEDHLLHVACRALMLYTRRKRKIKHEDDK